MQQLTRVFSSNEQALEIYKTQLSKQELFVEVFEAISPNTEVTLSLQNRQTMKSVTLPAKVIRMVRKNEAIENNYGKRAGVMLSVPFTNDVIEPLRDFFTFSQTTARSTAPSQPTRVAPSAKAASVATATTTPQTNTRPAAAQNASTAAQTASRDVPFKNLANLSENELRSQLNLLEDRLQNGSIFSLFNLTANASSKDIRSVFNAIVRNLHPDRHTNDYAQETLTRLEHAYQIFNDAYQVIQHPIKKDIYLEISAKQGKRSGISLKKYQDWVQQYRQSNAANIRTAASLLDQIRDDINKGNTEQAKQKLLLAKKYDPLNIELRSINL